MVETIDFSKEFHDDLKEIVYGAFRFRNERKVPFFERPENTMVKHDFINSDYVKSLGKPNLVDGLFQTKRIIENDPPMHPSGNYLMDINEGRHERYSATLLKLKELDIIDGFEGTERAPGGMMEYELFGTRPELLAFLYVYVRILFEGNETDESEDGKTPSFGLHIPTLERVVGFFTEVLVYPGRLLEIKKALNVPVRDIRDIRLECYLISLFSKRDLVGMYRQVVISYQPVIQKRASLIAEQAVLSERFGITNSKVPTSISYANFRLEFDNKKPILYVGRERIDIKSEIANLRGADRTNSVGQSLRTGAGLIVGILKEIGNDTVKLSQDSIVLEKSVVEWVSLIQGSGILDRKPPVMDSKESFTSRFRLFKRFVAENGLNVDVKAIYEDLSSVTIIISRKVSGKTS